MKRRKPPNKGVILFPELLHVRCTKEQRNKVIINGGGEWLRSLVDAAVESPVGVTPPDKVLRARKPRGRRVTLDKRKRAAV